MNIETKYQKLEPIEHILKKPGMYIGGIIEILASMWIIDDEKEANIKIIEKDIRYTPGLFKIFDEIIVNAYDQTIEDETTNQIKVNIDQKNNTISVHNNGKGIDVVIHPKENIYVPELIFSQLLTSTHFDENKILKTGGTFGYGAKLTAIFSESFEINIGDSINHKSFYQKYTNNLSQKTKPKIKPYAKKDGYVRITFKPDLKYFKLTEINNDFIKLMEKRVYDLAMLAGKKVKTYLNDKLINVHDLNAYMNMYTDAPKIFDNCDPVESQNRWKIGFTKSDNGFKCVSFVNGINTWNNGKHVDYIMSKVLKSIKEKIEKKYKNINIKDHFIKDNMFIFINTIIENPAFNSQTKDELITPYNMFGSVCNISEKTIKKLYELLDIDAIVKRMESNILTKITTVAHKIKNVPKLYDAFWAGTKKSNLCTLILTEGDSAKTMAISGLSSLNDPKKNIKGNDFYGVFPLKGKLLNVREATKKKIAENEEFVNLQKIIGLQINKEYTEENINELRYGKIILMMDADVDGSHIKGLFINMIDYFWPSLMKIDNFLNIFITPMIKATKGNDVIEFFSTSSYNKWKSNNQNSNYQIKYYKGLGTNTNDESKAYFKRLDKYLIDVQWDKCASDAVSLAFDKSMADDRKQWLKKYDPDKVIDYSKNKNITYSDFIYKELIHFSYYDNERSIPSLVDGLKPSQRKVLFCAFKKKLTMDIKVAQFVGYVSEHASYHHGEASLAKTIVNMAQKFVGSNNINLLVPSGQFGTRLMGGKDAASPRYIYTRIDDITRLIFDQRDDMLLHYLNDDGYMIEPSYYVPIIPMILVNGAEGIGTGYNTYIPNFNPLDIIEILLDKLNKLDVLKRTNASTNYNASKKNTINQIHPWYIDYTGNIKKIHNDLYETIGKYNLDASSYTLRITELPIGTWTENYKMLLEDDKLKNIVSKIKNNSDESTIDFIIKLKYIPEESEIIKIFQLNTNINLGHMYLHDKNNNLKKYDKAMDIINDFFDIRLEYYVKRKNNMLKLLEDEIANLINKLKFIKYVISDPNVFKTNKEIIIDQMIKKKIIDKKDESQYDMYFRLPFQSFTKEKVAELQILIDKKQSEYENIKKETIENMWKKDLFKLKDYLINIV